MKESKSVKKDKNKIAFVSCEYIGHNFDPYISKAFVDLYTTNYIRFNHQPSTENENDYCDMKNIFLRSELFKLQWLKLRDNIKEYSEVYLYIGKAPSKNWAFPSRDNMGYYEIIQNIRNSNKKLFIVTLGECDDFKTDVSALCHSKTPLNWVVVKNEDEFVAMMEKFQT